MPTLVLDPPPPAMEELLEHRRRTGADRHDEVWAGVYHVIPSASVAHSLVAQRLGILLDAPARAAGLVVGTEFNLGVKGDFRVPDLGVHRGEPHGMWMATVAIAVEILSPRDETWEKLPFYAAHRVDELLIVDPQARSVSWLTLGNREYRPVERSQIIDLGAAELTERIEWPQLDWPPEP